MFSKGFLLVLLFSFNVRRDLDAVTEASKVLFCFTFFATPWTTGVGEAAGKKEPSYSVGGNVN
jgi:hypothetical protein